MSADTLLARLDGVKRTGPDRWIARCPAHDDRHPSLSIRDADGNVLVKCWAGCSTAGILGTLDLVFEDLFPERPTHHRRPDRRPFPAIDVLRAVAADALTVAVAGSFLGNGGSLDDADRNQVLAAAARITAAVEESGHA